MERRLLPINDLMLGLRTLASSTGASEILNAPSIDIDRQKDKTTIRIGLPGVSSDELDVEVDNYIVTVSVEKRATEEENEDERTYAKREWFAGYKQSFSLSKDVDPANVTAELKDGLLTIVLPVSENKKSRKVEVKS